jgi:hypothetical protein
MKPGELEEITKKTHFIYLFSNVLIYLCIHSFVKK